MISISPSTTATPYRQSGTSDLVQALRRSELWWFLGWQDIRQRYRRSILGPFWLTLSTGIQIGTLGFLWAALFGQAIQDFLPFFAIGLVVWSLVSGVLIESCTAFTQFESIIRQIRLPFSAFLLRIVCRHVIIFFHNLVIIALVMIIMKKVPDWHWLLFIPGIMLVIIFALLASGPIAVFCTRFRDMPQIVINFVNIMYYLTPIMWTPATLRRVPWVYELNPLHHLFEIVRSPLLGALPTMQNYVWTLISISFLALAYLFFMGRYAHRVAYWI